MASRKDDLASSVIHSSPQKMHLTDLEGKTEIQEIPASKEEQALENLRDPYTKEWMKLQRSKIDSSDFCYDYAHEDLTEAIRTCRQTQEPEFYIKDGFLYQFSNKNLQRIKVTEFGKSDPDREIFDLTGFIDRSLPNLFKSNWFKSDVSYEFGPIIFGPDNKRIFLIASLYNSDESVVREFDLNTHQFVTKNNFAIQESKSSIMWCDTQSILISTNAEGYITKKTGYPRIVKQYFRGESLETAEEVYQGEEKDYVVCPLVFHCRERSFYFISRCISRYEQEYYEIQKGFFSKRILTSTLSNFVNSKIMDIIYDYARHHFIICIKINVILTYYFLRVKWIKQSILLMHEKWFIECKPWDRLLI